MVTLGVSGDWSGVCVDGQMNKTLIIMVILVTLVTLNQFAGL